MSLDLGNAAAGNTTPGPRVVECEAYGPVKLPLPELMGSSGRLNLNPEVENGDFFAVSLSDGYLTLLARGYVGYIPLNRRIVVKVTPRVPVSNLSRILRISGYPPSVLESVRGYATDAVWDDSLLDLYAGSLMRNLEVITTRGLLREYRRVEETSSFPRGRIQVTDTVRILRARGISHRVQIARSERTADLDANRCLKYAVQFLTQRYMSLPEPTSQSRAMLRRLNAAYSMFDGITVDPDRSFLADDYVTGQRPLPSPREYYRDALSVAVAIIEQRSVLLEEAGESIRLPSMVVNLNYAFEAYIRNLLRLRAEEDEWDAEVLDGNDDGKQDLFDTKPSVSATPDVVLRVAGHDVGPLVIEVKNVPVKDFFSARDAMNQAITYGVAMRSPRVVLVHPRASEFQEAGVRMLGRIGELELHQYRFDLGADQLEDEERRFTDAIANLSS